MSTLFKMTTDVSKDIVYSCYKLKPIKDPVKISFNTAATGSLSVFVKYYPDASWETLLNGKGEAVVIDLANPLTFICSEFIQIKFVSKNATGSYSVLAETL
ncbi:TPA: hypothetical protein N5Y90_002456 [Vibrio cholerae]|nr:hypothetical protein [Vibrio cholerae]EJB5295506.1 hypothetical protein [Vibrio cholerae]ELJ8610539.1 hypothetical protein [Vibrio cholerae]ELJ8706334.1 hypothetical protein [Vibrio cholerae]ELK5327578.1 hypothetical protein [Vibrio cholerae]